MDQEIIEVCMAESFIESAVPVAAQAVPTSKFKSLSADMRAAIIESLEGEDNYEIDRRAEDYGFRY